MHQYGQGAYAEIRNAMVRVQNATDELEALIAESCPGPHKYVQHDDGSRAWCDECRYTKAGQRPQAT